MAFGKNIYNNACDGMGKADLGDFWDGGKFAWGLFYWGSIITIY